MIWGNHEDNLSPADVFAREREYQGTWLNTNMPTHETSKVPRARRRTRGSRSRLQANRHARRHVAYIPEPGAFNGAQILDPWETLAEWAPRLHEEGADLVLPLCHLYEDQDENGKGL